jgi:RNA-binding protein
MPLSSKQARHLRALAHDLKPVVLVGDKGVSDAVVDKVDTELENHELIKVRVAADRDEVKQAGTLLCERTGAELAGSIGKVLMLYRRRREGKPTIVLPS